MRLCQKLNEILVRIEIYTKPPFSMTEHQIEKKKEKKNTYIKKTKKQGHKVKLLINNITMKFHEILIKIQ